MENKYFIPDIEDVYVGYELEWKCKIRNQDWEKTICDTDLISIIYDEYEHADFEEPYDEQFRVPYLTKEQIEAEGWYKVNDSYPIQTFKHSVNVDVEIIYNYETHYLFITIPGTIVFVEPYINYKANLFSGNCKDINTFRKIIKLLGI